MISLPIVVFVVGFVFLLIAALIHVLIFRFESLAWSKPATWKRFGVASQSDADVVRPMAFNQGFYNLFLAIAVFVGTGIVLAGHRDVGVAVALVGSLSMVAAASVLILSSPKLARAAVLQGAAPLLGSALVIVGRALTS